MNSSTGYKMNRQKFLNDFRSMVIAPAGYGKTYTIAKCVSENPMPLPILVLTHTNAGVASLKSKMDSLHITSSNYILSTICGYTEVLVNSFVLDKTLVLPRTNTNYYHTINELATKVTKAAPFQKFIKLKYSHIIVDEFQDCSTLQLDFIYALSRAIPLHVLGDNLQSIYGFKGEKIVDMLGTECKQLHSNVQYLDTAWRWNNVGKKGLASDLSKIRQNLLSGSIINLEDYNNIRHLICGENEKFHRGKELTRYERLLLDVRRCNNDESILLIHPLSEAIVARQKIIKRYQFLTLLEAVDDKLFYESARLIDSSDGNSSCFRTLIAILHSIATTSGLLKLVHKDGELVKARSKDNIIKVDFWSKIKGQLDGRLESWYTVLDSLSNIKELYIYRRQIFNDLKKAIIEAINKHCTVEEAMNLIHNRRKHVGRFVPNKCLGTTLLTKGLEFDHVILLDAHKIIDKNNFYVAITRGCKSLTIISETKTLSFPV